MNKKLQSQFSTRQYMLSKDFEIYLYNDTSLTKVNTHSHAYYEFYFFLEGDVSMQIDDTLYPVTFGDIMLIPPHIPHRPVIHSLNVPYRRFVFWISQEYCNHLIQLSPDYAYLMQYVQTNKDYLFHIDKITFYSIQSKALRLIEEMQSEHFGKHAQISLCVNDLVLHLNRIVYKQKHKKRSGEELSLYQNLCTFIEEHLDEDLSLERLSAEFFVSKYHISHIFKQNLGISIHQFITKKRLYLCREAIIGDMPITKAYQTFGFGDYSSFFRAFKKEYGISPKECQDMQLVKLDKD
ncbi:MAG: helix-turn-helix domain-containing protein [Lachnospiraceae bacterium]|nr:helix-turn-helix domain-containing protein [Lachnospiraceae bacterium]